LNSVGSQSFQIYKTEFLTYNLKLKFFDEQISSKKFFDMSTPPIAVYQIWSEKVDAENSFSCTLMD